MESCSAEHRPRRRKIGSCAAPGTSIATPAAGATASDLAAGALRGAFAAGATVGLILVTAEGPGLSRPPSFVAERYFAIRHITLSAFPYLVGGLPPSDRG